MKMKTSEVLLRICSVLVLVLTACLVGLDTQTKRFTFFERKATFRDLQALSILVDVASVAAGYNLLQLIRCSVLSARFDVNWKGSHIYLAWVCFLLDQIAIYITFAANSAALQASLLSLTGAKDFQWMKLCNTFTRFCFQIGGGLLSGFSACLLMAAMSSISAFNLFRLYSPKRFLFLK
ncbi:CASP-like protein 2C1 isoform X1 [Ziziphus jujuba]|uniref:CASP-like protein n=1 Tax=Ziziphus jujuba TaxID=326968 RepID=A0A6P3ZLQ4_ZIZJJ|nr:CASP-like protein 2C1 isoform X1 [Ziziphus jujuba]